jgi:alanine dehydrogenase
MKSEGTLLLTRREVADLLGIQECIAAVELAFELYGQGKTSPPGILGVHAADGGFHIKAGLMDLKRRYFVAKANANFPGNGKFGLPTIQGVIIVCDGQNGQLLAVMDSIEITILRTGAATTVAAKYLSREDSSVLTICGCGNQGRISLKMLSQIRPITKVFAYDVDRTRAEQFSEEFSGELQIEVAPVTELSGAFRQSDIIVTCTPSKRFFLKSEDISPGTFIAAVGSDNEEKQELEPALCKDSKLVVDILEQCATIGELHHALENGVTDRNDVHAELGEIVAGHKTGRAAESEIIVFDSTGMALQDTIAASIVYERAIEAKIGTKINFLA